VSTSNSSNEISGEFTIRIIARPGKSLNDIRKVVDEEITKFATGGPTSEEMQKEQAGWAMRFVSNLERIGGFGGIADQLNTYNTFLGDPDYFQKDFDRYQNVTAASVQSEFKKWVADAHRLEIYITPETSGRPDAVEFDRMNVPSTEAAVSFSSPITEKKTLANGLEIVVSQRPELPIVNARLMIKTCNLLETAAAAGESSLTAALMDEGTKKRNALKIRDDIDLLGSSLSVSGSRGGASVTISSLKSKLDATMEIMSDVILNPAFPKDEFDRLQKQTLDGILQRKSNPSTIADQIFAQKLYGEDHPFSRPSGGTESSVKNLGIPDLKKNYETFWRPNNAAIVFVGDISLDEATHLAEKYFGKWQRGSIPEMEVPDVAPPKGPVVYLVDKQGAPQSQIRIGSTAPNRYTKDYYPLVVSNTLLGGSFASRLNLNLREDKGYTYGAFSMVNFGRELGSWIASAGVQSKFTKESLVEFKKEITGLGGFREVTKGELEGVQKNLTRGYVQNFESNGMVLGQIASLMTYDLPLDEMSKYVKEVEQQTTHSVMAMAKKYFDFDQTITVVVGDLSNIEDPIRQLGWGKVIVVDADGKEVK